MINITLKQALVLQKFIADMNEIHDAPTEQEEQVFAILDSLIDAEKDHSLLNKQYEA